jgi:hypothetical protein
VKVLTSINEELGKDALNLARRRNRNQSTESKRHMGITAHLGLTGLEVITSDEALLPLGKLDGTWNKGVLRSSVDERYALENRGNSEDGGRRNFLVGFVDGGCDGTTLMTAMFNMIAED